MSYDDLTTGVVIRYPFLWSHEAEHGEIEGREKRPAAVGFRIMHERGDIILLFPITTKQPAPDRFASEIPETEKRRAGLDADLRLWIILDEFNEDVIGDSFYLEPEPPLGKFSRAYFLPLMREFIARRRNVSRAVRRTK